MELTIQEIGLGLITAQNDDLCLVGVFRSGNSPANQTRLKYQILIKSIINDSRNLGLSNYDVQEAAHVGDIELMIKDGTIFEVAGIQNIVIKKPFQNQAMVAWLFVRSAKQ